MFALKERLVVEGDMDPVRKNRGSSFTTPSYNFNCLSDNTQTS